jgi:Holliday junction resolvase RusA-like endonuclease
MADWQLVIDGEFETLNPYINAERGNRYAAASIKKTETERVALEARLMPAINEYPVIIHFRWYRKNAKTDPDNVDFARKFVLDGLVKAGILRNDTCREISRLIADVDVSDEPRLIVTIKPKLRKE